MENVEIELEKCDLPFNEDTIGFLSQKGRKLFICISETVEVFNHGLFKHEKSVTEKIVPLTINDTENGRVVLCNHSLFSPDDNVRVIGYCSVSFACSEDTRVFF